MIGAALRWAIFQVSPSRRKVIVTRNDIGTVSWLSATALRFEAIVRFCHIKRSADECQQEIGRSARPHTIYRRDCRQRQNRRYRQGLGIVL